MLTAKEIANRMRFQLSQKDWWHIDSGRVKYDPAIQYPKASYDAEVFIGRIEAMTDPLPMEAVLKEVVVIQTRMNELRATADSLWRVRVGLERSVAYRLLRYQVMTEDTPRLISRTSVPPWNTVLLEGDNLKVLEESATKMFVTGNELVYIQAPDGRGFVVFSRLLLKKVEQGEWKTTFLDHIMNPEEFRGNFPRPKLICKGQLIEENNL